MGKPEAKQKENSGILGWIERTGNKLPDPVLLFVIFAGIIILISWIGSLFGWSAVNPGDGSEVTVFNLISREGIVQIFTNFSANIKSFSALTDQMVVLLGLALLEGTGLASVLMRRFFVKMPPKYVTLALTFVAVSSSVASDAGFMLLPPLAAMLFLATGRNPIAGIVAAYGSVAAGFASSFFIGVVEVVGMGYTQQAAQIIDPNITVPVTSNYYYTFLTSILLPLAAFFVTIRIVEPRLGPYHPEDPELLKDAGQVEISEREAKGLRMAGIAALLYIAAIALMTLPHGAILRDPQTDGLMESPFMSSIILIVSGMFFFPGLAFGYTSGSLKNHKDVVRCLTNTYASLAGYILVAICAGQLIKYFEWSNLGIIFAVNGAEFLKNSGVPTFALLLLTIFFVICLNFLMPSHAGKLAFIGPILVPLFMMLGVSPAATYLAYRIGDSVSNAITPMMAYFVLTIGYVQKYKKDAGMGTLIANLLPYSIAFAVVYIGLLAVFYFLDLPLGPGVTFHYLQGGIG